MLLSSSSVTDLEPEDCHGIYKPSEDVPYLSDSIERVARAKEEEMHPIKFEDLNVLNFLSISRS